MIHENIIKAANILYNCRIKLKRIDNLPINLIPQNKKEAYKTDKKDGDKSKKEDKKTPTEKK